MERRQLLKTVAGTGVLGAPLLSGCAGRSGEPDEPTESDDACSTDGTSYDWCVSETVEFDTVVGDTVLGRIDTTERRVETQEVAAFSAETGAIEWRYETERGVDHFTALTVQDGIFLTRSGSQDGNGVVALDMDGPERWTRETAVGHRRPRVVDNTVYVSRETGLVQAFDAPSGDRRWKNTIPDRRPNPRLVDVTDAVTVETSYAVLGLDPTSGTVRWAFDTGEQLILDTRVLNGRTYVVTEDRIAAVSDGAEEWGTAFNRTTTETRIVGIASGRVFVFAEDEAEGGFRLHAFDGATGERSWNSEAIRRRVEWEPRAAVGGDVAYLGGETLRALDANTGDERWQASVGDGPIQHLSVIDDGGAVDHTVFVQGGETQLATFSHDGEQTWGQSVEAPDWAAAEAEYVFTGTENAMFAVNRESS